ncbi:hypothetical protein GJ744_006949 [Endocarpon pusillum]|uniref:Uncharacterized protein n=1 Tax=Endocarpon pusillum TaxID=364733 RepID=A0A8H7E6Q4_9EURO|nr:hypothetical protein GJ744_006949 [Endocarpon pusillum]
MASHRVKESQRHYSDEYLLYRPAWLTRPRGFIKFKEKEAQEFNDLIDAFIPKDVRHWDCREDDWVFSYAETVLRVTNRPD